MQNPHLHCSFELFLIHSDLAFGIRFSLRFQFWCEFMLHVAFYLHSQHRIQRIFHMSVRHLIRFIYMTTSFVVRFVCVHAIRKPLAFEIENQGNAICEGYCRLYKLRRYTTIKANGESSSMY